MLNSTIIMDKKKTTQILKKDIKKILLSVDIENLGPQTVILVIKYE